jgi:hypothetical protein
MYHLGLVEENLGRALSKDLVMFDVMLDGSVLVKLHSSNNVAVVVTVYGTSSCGEQRLSDEREIYKSKLKRGETREQLYTNTRCGCHRLVLEVIVFENPRS